jgi:hypothetical protein
VMGDGTIVMLEGSSVFVVDRATGNRQLICSLMDVSPAGAYIRAEDLRGGRIFISADRGTNGVASDRVIEVDLRTGEALSVPTAIPFLAEVTFFPPTGELLHRSDHTGLIATHPTTGAQRLLATAEELGIPSGMSEDETILCADVNPARDRMFFQSHKTGRIVVALSGLA